MTPSLKNRKRIIRAHADVPRRVYSFTLHPDNVERVRSKKDNLSEWVDRQFQNEANIMDWKSEVSRAWNRLLEKRSDAVKAIATAYPPTQEYRMRGDTSDARYLIRQYEEADGVVSLLCEKIEAGSTDGYGVFGVKPQDLVAL